MGKVTSQGLTPIVTPITGRWIANVRISFLNRATYVDERLRQLGQFVSDGKDPLRTGSDHHADSIGQANQFGWLIIFWQVGNSRSKT